MQENMPKGALEDEIAKLTEQIEAKRNQLEAASAIVVDEEIVKSVVQEQVIEPVMESVQPVPAAEVEDSSDLSANQKVELEEAITLLKAEGIEQAIKSVKGQHPLVIDTFHDTLIAEYTDLLKERGIIS